MNEPRIYVPKSKAKAVQTKFGDVLRLGFHAESLIAFVRANANQAGYVNLDVVPRKATDEWGNTHSIVLNTWKPGDTPRPATTRKPTPNEPDDTEPPF